MKKIITLIFTFLLAFSSLSPLAIEAKDNPPIKNSNSEDIYDTFDYKGRKYKISPDLSFEEKSQLVRMIDDYGYEPEGIVIALQLSSTCNFFNKNDSQIGIIPLTLGKEKMNTQISIEKISDPGYDHFKIGAIAAWNPDYTATTLSLANDKFALNWGDNFALMSNSDTVTTYYDSMIDGTRYKLSNRALRDGVVPNTGISWTLPYFTYYGGTQMKLGYIMIYVEVRKINSSGIANVVAQYARATTSKSFTVSITDAGITFSGAYESAMPAYRDMEY